MKPSCMKLLNIFFIFIRPPGKRTNLIVKTVFSVLFLSLWNFILTLLTAQMKTGTSQFAGLCAARGTVSKDLVPQFVPRTAPGLLPCRFALKFFATNWQRLSMERKNAPGRNSAKNASFHATLVMTCLVRNFELVKPMELGLESRFIALRLRSIIRSTLIDYYITFVYWCQYYFRDAKKSFWKIGKVIEVISYVPESDVK